MANNGTDSGDGSSVGLVGSSVTYHPAISGCTWTSVWSAPATSSRYRGCALTVLEQLWSLWRCRQKTHVAPRVPCGTFRIRMPRMLQRAYAKREGRSLCHIMSLGCCNSSLSSFRICTMTSPATSANKPRAKQQSAQDLHSNCVIVCKREWKIDNREHYLQKEREYIYIF